MWRLKRVCGVTYMKLRAEALLAQREQFCSVDVIGLKRVDEALQPLLP